MAHCNTSSIFGLLFSASDDRLLEVLRDQIDLLDTDGTSLLHRALARRRFSFVLALLQRGASCSARDDEDRTPLHYAAGRLTETIDSPARCALVKAMLERGADPNALDCHGNSPLWAAVLVPRSDANVVRLLVSAGAEPNHKNKVGASPLEFARKTGEIHLVEIMTTKV